MDHEEAVKPVTLEAVAEIIMQVSAEDDRGASGPHAVRPVRTDDRMVSVPVESLGHLVTAAAQRPASRPPSTTTVRQRSTFWTSPPRSARPW